MAILRVWDGGTGAADGSTWTDAYLTLQAALTGWGVTDEIWMASDHVESSASSFTFTCLASDYGSRPIPIFSIDRSDDSYLKGSVAQLEATGTADIEWDCYVSVHGVYMSSGDDINFDVVETGYFEDCTIEWGSTGARFFFSSLINSAYRFKNCIFTAATGNVDCRYIHDVEFDGCTFDFVTATGGFLNLLDGMALFNGCDLSSMSGILGDTSSWSSGFSRAVLYGCKLPASGLAFTDGAFQAIGCDPHSSYIQLIGCDQDGGSFGKIFRSERHCVTGDVVTDTANYRDSGWSDEGSTGLSYAYTPISGCTRFAPLPGLPLTSYIDTTGSKTFTVEILENFTVALTDSECWMEIFYLGTSDSAHMSRDNSTRIRIGAGTTLTTSTEAWTEVLTGERKAKISKTLTVNKTGLYEVRVYLAKYEASAQLNVCPQVEVT